mgnify:CR=1 FL=1
MRTSAHVGFLPVLFSLLLNIGGAVDICAADTVYLKNGRRMVGTVVKRTPEKVVLDLGIGSVTFRVSEISSIEDGPVSFPGQPTPISRATLPTTPVGAPDPAVAAFPSTPSVALPSSLPASADVIQLADVLLPVVSALRGLAVRSPVEKRLADKATVRNIVQREMAKRHSNDALARKGKALIKLGLLPPYVNLQEYVIHLYTHQLAGMYDPDTNTLYLADWIPAQMQAGVVAHELVHALQDQHFDLLRYMKDVEGNSEAQAARQAVVEGEAMAIMLDYHLMEQGRSFTSLGNPAEWIDQLLAALREQDPSASSMPTYLQETALFPYINGLAFLQAVCKRHPWSWVATLYDDPPRSTEQILHPDKYLVTRDDPTLVTLVDVQDLLGEGWSLLDEDVAGEFTMKSLVRQYAPAVDAVAVAAGWDGDRYRLYEEAASSQLLLVWVSVWDSEADAAEFLRAYRQLIVEKYLEAQPVEGLADSWRTESGYVHLAQLRERVVIVEGAPTPHPHAFIQRLQLSNSTPPTGS